MIKRSIREKALQIYKVKEHYLKITLSLTTVSSAPSTMCKVGIPEILAEE